jgi:phosphotriesterase-related protein
MPEYTMTVRGVVDSGELGPTLTHEHVFCDLAAWQVPPRTERQTRWSDESIRMDMLGEVRRDALVFRDNLRLDDEAVAAAELQDMREVGVKTLVELSVQGLHGRPEKLLELATLLDLNIVVGCGYYIQPSHPSDLHSRSVEELTEELLSEIADGFPGSGIRPGVIGEIGTGQPVHQDEQKVLDAACNAQLETGLPLYVHVYPMADGHTALTIATTILDRGVDPGRVNICHMDGRLDFDYQSAVLDTGVFISFDTFGQEAYYDAIDRRSSFDAEREAALIRLLEAGYERQLLLSQDNCLKVHLCAYGGYGYGHIMRHIVPSLARRGVPADTIDRLMTDNPRRLLTITRSDT